MLEGGLPAQTPIGSSLAAWGYVFQINTETVAVGANVNFSNNGPLNGISHTPGTAAVTVAADGTYNITFSVYTTQNNPQDWAVAINGVNSQRFNSAGQTITGTTSLALKAGDRVTVRNVATSPDPAALRTGDFTTAYMLIYKVDS
ncbi:MAG: BclA C-terminal domain-containing protein [Deltaproteobacteria bacterium]